MTRGLVIPSFIFKFTNCQKFYSTPTTTTDSFPARLILKSGQPKSFINKSNCATRNFVSLSWSSINQSPVHSKIISMAPALTVSRIENTILLFDVDGTLTKSRQLIEPDMYNFLLHEVKPRIPIGLVGGSDLAKILEQMRGDKVLDELDYVFSENGLVAHGNGELIATQSIQSFIGEDKLQKFINFSLGYMANLELPIKRGTFIEFRNGMINICPVGRSCSQQERLEFYEYDKVHRVRENFVQALKREFPNFGLTFSIGGQISFDVFPTGWDKTYCLKYLTNYPVIHFFGDKVQPGENDHEIYEHERTIGHFVQSPQDTKEQVTKLLQTLS